MQLNRLNMYENYLADKITHQGFDIKRVDKLAPVNPDALMNSKEFMDSEYSCDCGAFIGSDIIGQTCPLCNSEILLRSINFRLTGWLDLGDNYVITPTYYKLLQHAIGLPMLRFILGDYTENESPRYSDKHPEFYENKAKKKKGRLTDKGIESLLKKIPLKKQIYKGLGHNEFRKRFYEIIDVCTSEKSEERKILMEPGIVEAVFTNKIPIYSSAFRPVSKTSETMFYPEVNKNFAKMTSIAVRLCDMTLFKELCLALNTIQEIYMKVCEDIIKEELSKKTGNIRTEIVGGTFNFSARSVITLDISLDVDEVDVPYVMFLEAYRYKIAHIIAVRYNYSLERALLKVKTYENDPIVDGIIQELLNEGAWIYLIREPANNLASIELCRIRHCKKNDDTLSLPPEPLGGFNADFDGDQLDLVFLPKEIVKDFEPFHYSCMADYIGNNVRLDWKEWCAISMARMCP